MGHHLDVQVVDRNGRAERGVRVEVLIEGLWKGGSIVEFTGSDGHASFETASDYESSRNLSIKVHSEWHGPYRIGDGAYTVQTG